MMADAPQVPQYEAVRYAADGHAGEQIPADPALSDGAVLMRGTLAECRAAIAARITLPLETARWAGLDGDIEAYHESSSEGCGGWAIRPARHTMAEQVADLLHRDGQAWASDDGRTWADLTADAHREERYAPHPYDPGVRGALVGVRYEFADGSALLEAGSGAWWDIEVPGQPWHTEAGELGVPDEDLDAGRDAIDGI